MEHKPSNRELRVLEHLCLGDTKELARMPHIGMATISEMLSKKWIIEAEAEKNGRKAFRITALGSQVFEKYFRYLRH